MLRTATTPRCSRFLRHGHTFSTLGALPPRVATSTSPPLPSSKIDPPPPVDLPPQQQTKKTSRQSLPTRHSRKNLPHIMTDPDDILRHADAILSTQTGELFSFDSRHSDHNQAAAWTTADTTVQIVESILRGFAWHVQGSLWNRALEKQPPTTQLPLDEIPSAMEELVERVYEEGLAYMSVRSGRLQELEDQQNNDPLEALLGGDEPLQQEPLQGSLFLAESSKDLTTVNTDQKRQDVEQDPFLHEFALPGPTTAMYDTMLDVAAVLGDESLRDRVDLWNELIWMRHELDGGCASNTNEFTRPTCISFNAVIRYASNLSPTNTPVRDDAIALGFSTYQTLDEIQCVHKNSASVEYTLLLIAKFMPASRIRGNIAAGIFQQARYHGLINDAVIHAYKQTNIPSNSDEDDTYILEQLADGIRIPPKWKRNSKKYRYTQRDGVY